jgi:2-polyprenyl-3-methyl-5-hydroxy-6-metoxy-1,4-benzoquinol methylase
MQYDPIKRTLGNVFNKSPFLRKIFYRLLDLLLLRSWHIHKEFKLFLNTLENKKLEILDAGMGFGQYTYYMAKKLPQSNILAVDVKEEQVEDCNQFFRSIGYKNVKAEVEDLTKYVKEDSFHFVLCVDVMEHIEEDVLVFENICKSLKKGGMLLISTPSDQGGSDVDNNDGQSFIEEHVRDGYNIKEIEEKLKRGGFSKVEARYSYGISGNISWRISMKYPIKMLGVSKLFFIVLPLYYLVFYPFAFLFNYLDTNLHHEKGTGLIVKAWK